MVFDWLLVMLMFFCLQIFSCGGSFCGVYFSGGVCVCICILLLCISY